MTTRVAIVGGTGRLGRIIHRVATDLDGFEVVAVLDSTSGPDDAALADLVVDATHPAVSGDVVAAAVARGQNVLVGTSGWSAQRVDALRADAEAAGVGVLVVPNFSLGSVVGTALAAAAAPLFDSVEIVEAHHAGKADSPSGTAVRTAELIGTARREPVAAPHVDQRARGQQVSSVPIHSLRRPGVIARQETILSGPGETLSIVHDTVDSASAYAPGIRLALRAAVGVSGVVVGLEDFVDIGIRLPGSQRGAEDVDLPAAG